MTPNFHVYKGNIEASSTLREWDEYLSLWKVSHVS